MIFKSWLTDLTKVQKVVNNIRSINTISNGANTALNPNVIKSLSSEINGLTLKQAKLALSTKKLTKEQRNEVLIESGLIASENKIQSELLQSALAQAALSKEKQNAILTELNLMDIETKEIFTTKSCTKEELLNILATKGISGANEEAILSALGLSAANGATAISFDVLTASIWGTISALAANPLTWIVAGIAALGAIINSEKRKLEELRESAEEASNTYKESASSIDDYVKRYAELRQSLLAAKGDEEETYNIKKQLLELQSELNEQFGEEYGYINLVTNAYKDQTEAIRAYSKEAAHTLLNENIEGIEDAAEAMTKKRRYNLGNIGLSSYTEEGKALKDIAEKYTDRGLRINEDYSSGTYNLILETDAQSAYDIINEFESDVRSKAIELGDEHLFDNILKLSSNELKKSKEVIDEYGNIFRQSLIANITVDDQKAIVYNDALNAVSEYNDALIESSDPYNDERVAAARENLKQLKGEVDGYISSDISGWGKYASIMEAVFAQAYTGLFDFNEKLRNDDSMIQLAKNLDGMSKVDLQSLNPGENASFDELKEAADSYEVELEDLIDALVRLGYVQGEINDKPVKEVQSVIHNKLNTYQIITHDNSELYHDDSNS